MRPEYTTANAVNGAKLAGAIGHLEKGIAELRQVFAAMDAATAAAPRDFSKLETGTSFGGGAGQGQGLYDAVGLVIAMIDGTQTGGITPAALGALSNGG